MRMNIFSQNPESSHPKTCLFICVFNSVFKLLMFFFLKIYVLRDTWLAEERETGRGNVTRKVDMTALWGRISHRKMKRSARKRACSPTRSLSAHGFVWRGEVASWLGAWGLVQFAHKLPFREAREDLRAFSARLWVGVFPV